MCVLCMFIVGFMLLDFQFYVCIVYVYSGFMLLYLQFYVCIVYVYSGVHVTRSLVLCAYCVCLQWGSCYSIFSFMCVLCMFIVGFMLLFLQFYLCIVYVFSGVHVTRSLILCVYCECLQWGSCYSIFNFMCLLCMSILGSYYPIFQFYVCIVYVYSGVHVTRSLVLCAYCVCLQWGSCYSIFSFMCVLWYVYSGVHVTRSLVLCVYCVCLQWGSCYSIFSFMCVLCMSIVGSCYSIFNFMCVLCMFIVGFMLLDLQFYVCIVYVYSGVHVTRFQFYVCIVYVYSGVHVTLSLVLCVYCVCLQWGSCYSIFSFMCLLCMSIVGFMLLDLQFYVCIV